MVWYVLLITDLRDGSVGSPYDSKKKAQEAFDKITDDPKYYDVACTLISVPKGTIISF